MTAYTGVWDREGVADFLDAQTIPVRVATTTPSGHLWMVSLWFRHREGHLECATGAGADLVEYLRADPAVAFEVSTNEVPYRGVRGRGSVGLAPDEDKETLRSLIERYLGGTDSGLARRLLDPDRDEVRIRIDPAKVYSWDFSERMGDVEGDGEE
jgi:nitroimidazol reductase NimA-like FMN-containing flavoprotein (pyridoxamine 5'-phosphate oxidase superfamily)